MRFSEIINEGRDAPLYHGTSRQIALAIIMQGKVRARTEQKLHKTWDDPTLGVSLTRDLRVALEKFGPVVFQFDQTRLVQRMKVIPWDYWGSGYEVRDVAGTRRQGQYAEAEEFVVGDIPFSLVTAILMTENTRRHIQSEDRINGQETGSEGGLYAPLLRHPLLRIIPERGIGAARAA
jgi:hypothetical protein